MNERAPITELSEQFVTDLAYLKFIKLAQTYGSEPKELRINPEDVRPDARTLTVEIPSDDVKQTYPDVLSGIDYGAGSNVIEIFYHKGRESAKVYITKGAESGNTKMHTIRVLSKQPIEGKGKAHTFDLDKDETKKADIYTIASLLKKAEVVLRINEEKKFEEKTAAKPTIRQRLSKRIKDFLLHE